MIELTCEKCPMSNRGNLTCQACKLSMELRKVLKESMLLKGILDNKSCSVKYRDKKLIDLRFTLMNRQVSTFKKILTETSQFEKLESMNLGEYEIFIETIHSESDQSWDVKVTLHLPESIADSKYCSIKH